MRSIPPAPARAQNGANATVPVTATSGALSICSDPGWLRQVDQRANAFYQLNAYPAHNTDDANKDTAWVGRFRSNGHDEIAWRLGGQPRSAHGVRLICLTNGWARDINTYNGTGRARRITVIGKRNGREVEGDGCRRTRTLPRTKPDNFGRAISIRFNCKADVVAIRITKIHPAAASPMFGARTVALSDAQFWG